MWALIVTLVVVGLILLGIEMLVIPGFGVMGILGIVSFVASCYLAFATFGVVPGFLVSISTVVLITLFVVLVLRSRTWKRIALNTNIDSKADETPQHKGIAVGMTGISLTRLAPAGMAEINGVTIEVFCRDTIIDASSRIEVVDVSDNKVFVKVLT